MPHISNSSSSPSDGDDAVSTVAPPVVDLVANGVWRPVAALLAERFPGRWWLTCILRT